MNNILYLSKRRRIYFFRRRVPRLSTCFRPVLVSLGTTDQRQALRLCVQLTAYMDLMLDDDLHTSLPEADVTAFFQAELRSYMRSLKTKRIVEHVEGANAPVRSPDKESILFGWLAQTSIAFRIELGASGP